MLYSLSEIILNVMLFILADDINYTVSKCHSLLCCTVDKHEPTLMIFGRNVSEKKSNQKWLLLLRYSKKPDSCIRPTLLKRCLTHLVYSHAKHHSDYRTGYS